MTNMELPPGEIKGVAVTIHPSKPESCPQCGCEIDSCPAASGLSINISAWQCKNGHRTHAFSA